MSGDALKLSTLLLGCIAIIAAGAYLAHSHSVEATQPERTTGSALVAVQAVSPTVISTSAEQQSSSQPSMSADEQVAKWIREAFDINPTIRAAAINGLATAPSAAAVPTLQRVLIYGEPMFDRPLALDALRTLALKQGDHDGGVRAAVREAIYDGSDEDITQRAQSVLEEVETALDHGKG